MKALSLLFVLLSCASLNLKAEGTKQIRPSSGDFGYIQINDRSRTFATYVATPDERLNIHISNSREKIYYGFGRMFNGSTTHTDVWYRIRKPDGTIVFGGKTDRENLFIVYR